MVEGPRAATLGEPPPGPGRGSTPETRSVDHRGLGLRSALAGGTHQQLAVELRADTAQVGLGLAAKAYGGSVDETLCCESTPCGSVRLNPRAQRPSFTLQSRRGRLDRSAVTQPEDRALLPRLGDLHDKCNLRDPYLTSSISTINAPRLTNLSACSPHLANTMTFTGCQVLMSNDGCLTFQPKRQSSFDGISLDACVRRARR